MKCEACCRRDRSYDITLDIHNFDEDNLERKGRKVLENNNIP